MISKKKKREGSKKKLVRYLEVTEVSRDEKRSNSS